MQGGREEGTCLLGVLEGGEAGRVRELKPPGFVSAKMEWL